MRRDDDFLLLSTPNNNRGWIDSQTSNPCAYLLKTLDLTLESREVTIPLLEIIIRESPIIWRKVQIIGIIIDNSEIFDNFRPAA